MRSPLLENFIIYGPFSYNGLYTSDSNQLFNQQLQRSNTGSCIKDFDTINTLLSHQGLILQHDISMPAHNQLMLWQRS